MVDIDTYPHHLFIEVAGDDGSQGGDGGYNPGGDLIDIYNDKCDAQEKGSSGLKITTSDRSIEDTSADLEIFLKDESKVNVLEIDMTEDLNPYFSSTVYLQVDQGSVRVELIDGSGEKFPKDKLAETNVKETRAIKIGGTEPDASPAQIKIIAQSDNTVFYLDAITLTQSSYALEYAPLMGPKALWIEAGKYLKKYGGDRPDVWQGEVKRIRKCDL